MTTMSIRRALAVLGAWGWVLGAGFWVLGAGSAVLGSGIAYAQTPAPIRRVEFNDAIREAVEKNPTIGQAALAVTRADALIAQARSFQWPSISAVATNTTLDGTRGSAGNVTQPQNQFTLGASVQYRVGAWLALNQARDQMTVATATSLQAKQGVAVAAAQAYLAVIAARRQVEVNDRALTAARAHFDYADRRFTGGVGSNLNRLRANQVVIGAQLLLEQAQLALSRAQEALGVAMASDGPVDAGAEPGFDLPATIDESTWMTMRPDLVTEAAIRRAAERVVKDYYWQEWAPLPVVSFDPQYVTPSSAFSPPRTWRLTVSAVQPVFDGGLRKATKRLRVAEVDQSNLIFTGIQIQARSEIRVAQTALATLERSLTAARQGATESSEILRITNTAFEVGASTNIEVIDAQRSLRDAETAVAGVEDAVRRARLDLLVALGRFPN